MREKNNFKSAFTLAEVLVTLGIIGIVAAMTIPTLQANYQKQEYVTRLKKAYTAFNQALMQMSADMGCIGNLKCTGLFIGPNEPTRNQNFGDEIVKYFKTIEVCPAGQNVEGCHVKVDGSPNYTGTPLSGGVTWGLMVIAYRFVTLDGMSYSISNSSNNCSDTSGQLKQICAYLMIDTNGFRPPNVRGRDIFAFWIINDKGPRLYPVGGQLTSNWWKTAAGVPRYCIPTNPVGSGCAARIIEEGWQMNY